MVCKLRLNASFSILKSWSVFSSNLSSATLLHLFFLSKSDSACERLSSPESWRPPHQLPPESDGRKEAFVKIIWIVNGFNWIWDGRMQVPS